jgi:Holliday junction resolvasome RuvABC endonuclease subunit
VAIKSITHERNPNLGTIIGVDSSSLGIAWTALYRGKLSAQGKIDLSKIRNMQDKMVMLYEEWKHILGELRPDHIFIEKSIFVKNPATARTLSYIVGSIMVISAGEGYSITDVEPATWKAFLGYKNLSSKFVSEAKKKLGTTEGSKLCDGMRKSQTWRVIQHNFPDQTQDTLAEHDHDIADSWGIALYGHDLLVEELHLEKSKEVTLDLERLGTLGLAL